MRLIRLLLALSAVSLALTTNPALAQKLSFGPIAGVAIANWRGADVHASPSFHTGLMGGGFVALRLHKSFALEAQVLYARKGTVDHDSTCAFAGSCQALTASYTQDFIEIPLLFTVALPSRFAPTISAGPAVAFQTSCTFRSTGPLSEAPCDSLFTGAAGHPSMKHTDALLVFGGGFQVGQFGILVRYDQGLTKFLYRGTTDLDFKTKAWLVGVRYRLSR